MTENVAFVHLQMLQQFFDLRVFPGHWPSELWRNLASLLQHVWPVARGHKEVRMDSTKSLVVIHLEKQFIAITDADIWSARLSRPVGQHMVVITPCECHWTLHRTSDGRPVPKTNVVIDGISHGITLPNAICDPKGAQVVAAINGSLLDCRAQNLTVKRPADPASKKVPCAKCGHKYPVSELLFTAPAKRAGKIIEIKCCSYECRDAAIADYETTWNAEGHVYVVCDNHNRVKVGFAVSVQRRLGELQVGNGSHLVLMGTLPGKRQLERAIHDELRRLGKHIIGEWFRYDVVTIVALTNFGFRLELPT